MQTRSPTSIQTPEKQLAEIQLTHWDDEHDLGLQGERDRTTAQLAVGDTRTIPAEAVSVAGNPVGRTCETGLKGKDIDAVTDVDPDAGGTTRRDQAETVR